MDFTNKTAISTGAASGMGLLFSQNFADLGGNIVMCDVNEAVLKEKVDEINAKGKGKAIGIICDVRDYTQVCNARDKAVETFGIIDIVVNFAGGTAVRMRNVDRNLYSEFPDVPIDVYDWGIDVNLKGPFYFAHAVLKQMREQKCGLIINIGSITGMFKFSADVRKVMYTTNAIESLNSALRRLNSQRSVFPSDTALLKALYLATFEATKKWTMPLRNWGKVYGELSIMYDGRI